MKASGLTEGSLLALALVACIPYGFAGGGLPAHIRSMAIVPFENETASAELQNEIQSALQEDLRGRLGLRNASSERADALVRGTIRRYDVDVPVGFSADPRRATTATRRLQITVDVEILDQTTGRTLWQRRGLAVDAPYSERSEPEGRRRAIEKLVNEIIEGAQSQW